MPAPWEKSHDKCRQHIKKQRHYFTNKGPSSESYSFPVVVDGCESWTIQKAKHWRIDAFELWCWRRLERPLYYKEIKPVHPKGNQPWILIARTEAEATLLWPPDAKSWLIGKDPGAGKDWGQEKGEIEDQMVRWHHQLKGHEFEQTQGDHEGQGNLMCCTPWDCRQSDKTGWLNSNKGL